ncbi:MAG: hypothetical protein K6E30_00250 [Lachnospiraceae bacterium]|nr:hypothetical protein [Lachnospiraceae bacterium]
MKTLKFIDMTLRQAGPSFGKNLTFREKLEIARSLDRLRADTIELAPISGSRADQLANKTIASMVETRISAAVNLGDGNVKETWESIRNAKKPKLNLIAPVSPVQMEYICHKKAPAMLELIRAKVQEARALCDFVEFSAEDATRAEPEFLYQALNAAIEAGANKITVSDAAGEMLPDEFGVFISNIMANVPGLSENPERIELYVQIKDQLGMAVASAAAAVRQGAVGVKCLAIEDGYPTLEDLARFVQAKGVALDLATQVRVTELHRAVGQLEKILKTQEVSKDLEELGNVCLSSTDDIGEVVKATKMLGYDLSDEDNARVFERFKSVSGRRKSIGGRELDAIVASEAMQVPATYKIKSYVITSGNEITATANILLVKGREIVSGLGIGDGPIDAAFDAIGKIVGVSGYELDDFQVKTVTRGSDAMGMALVKLRANGRIYSGEGVSTDIIGASIRAYVSTLNKIVYEERG